MNGRDQIFLGRIEPILREMYGKNWDYDVDVNQDGIYLRLNVWREPHNGRQDEIDSFLRLHDYDSVEAWAEDSDYVRHGNEWRDEHGNTVDIHECLIGVIDEMLRAYE